jgi:hypothetical protein
MTRLIRRTTDKTKAKRFSDIGQVMEVVNELKKAGIRAVAKPYFSHYIIRFMDEDQDLYYKGWDE